MTRIQKIELRLSECRTKLNGMLDTPTEERSDTWQADLDATTKEIRSVESEYQAALLAAGDDDKVSETREDNETREERELADQVDFSEYVRAAVIGRPVTGAEAEYNQHLGIDEDHFPLDLLTRDLPTDAETRAAIDGDGRSNQGSWVDRLFADTAARRLGITFPSVSPGTATFPVMTAGGTPVQRGRMQAATVGTYTVNVEELKPTRNAVHGVYSIEDTARLPGLADAIIRDMRSAVVEKIDRTIFKGDSGANENTADITGLQTASITEATLTQANKVKPDKVIELFAGYVDGIHAASLDDVAVVVSVGTNQLWAGTFASSAVSTQTIAQFLRASGLSWGVRAEIDTNTANGDFGAYVGLRRGQAGTAVAPVWQSAQLIRDPYTGAAKGEVALTLNYLWAFGIPRTANYKRLKYTS